MIKRNYIFDDVLAGVAFYVRGELGGISKLQGFFCDAREKYSILDGLLSFSTNSVSRWSKQLEGAVDVLSLSRILTMDGDLERYSVSEKGKRFIEKDILPLFNSKERTQLIEMAQSF